MAGRLGQVGPYISHTGDEVGRPFTEYNHTANGLVRRGRPKGVPP